MTALQIQIDTILDFIVGLLNTPSPTGYTIEAIDYVENAFAGLGMQELKIARTPKGALRMKLDGKANDARRGITAHVDTLGLMVKEIKPNGRLKTTQLGSFPWNAVEFEGVTIRTFDNRRFRGTVVPDNPSTHVNRNIREQKRDADTMEVRIDADTQSAQDTRDLGIEVGDFVFLDPRVEVTDTGFIRSRHLDNKAGVAAIFGAVLALQEANLQPVQDTYILLTNYEEVGHGGAAGFPDSLEEMLAVDMAAIGYGQSSDEFSTSICVKDGGGPYHHEMTSKLRQLAQQHDVNCKVDIYPYYASDGTAYWRSGGSAKVALVGPGIDASHAYERTHQDSLLHSALLIAHYLLT